MPICKKCESHFPNTMTIDGKQQFLHKRKFCLACSPFGTRKLCGPAKKLRELGSDKVKCPTCEKVHVISGNSSNLRCSTCRGKELRYKNKSFVLNQKGAQCLRCGYNRFLGALGFHHVDPSTKSFTLSTAWHRINLAELVEEAKKCVVLCRICHAELHGGLWSLDSNGRMS